MNDQELQPATMQEQLDEISAQLHDAMAGMIAELVAMWERLRAYVNDSLADALQALVDAIGDLSYDVQPKKKHPRPPRYAGPKNKGRPWTMAPQRVARSNCRRYRR